MTQVFKNLIFHQSTLPGPPLKEQAKTVKILLLRMHGNFLYKNVASDIFDITLLCYVISLKSRLWKETVAQDIKFNFFH